MKKPKTEVVTGILSGVAMIGVAATGILSAMRAPRYKDILEECNGSKPMAILKTHWPAIVAGTVTEVCIGAAWGLGAQAIGALTAAAGYLATNRDAIEKKIKEYTKESDDNVLREIKQEVNKEYVAKNIPTRTSGPAVEETDRGDLLCFEGYSGRRRPK